MLQIGKMSGFFFKGLKLAMRAGCFCNPNIFPWATISETKVHKIIGVGRLGQGFQGFQELYNPVVRLGLVTSKLDNQNYFEWVTLIMAKMKTKCRHT